MDNKYEIEAIITTGGNHDITMHIFLFIIIFF